MPVTVWLTSGERRVVEEADGADMDGAFVRFTAPDRLRRDCRRTVLTLRATDVDHVDVEKDGTVTRITPAIQPN